MCATRRSARSFLSRRKCLNACLIASTFSCGHGFSLAAVPGVQLFSLQVGDGQEQLAALGGRFAVIDLGNRFDSTSFADAAAVVKNLDLVIAVDSAIVHLAGALGAPIWVALALSPDWRWLLQRDDSPWYPTARLFRQTRLDDWGQVFQRMAGDLAKLISAMR